MIKKSKKYKIGKIISQDVRMNKILDEVLKAGGIIAGELEVKKIVSALTEQLFDIIGADLSCFYSSSENQIRLLFRRGKYRVPELFSADDELFQFVSELREALVLNERKRSPFITALLNKEMQSGIVCPVGTRKKIFGFSILNSRIPLFFNRAKLQSAESITRLTGEYFQNSVLHEQLRAYTKKIEALERYQENIFSSMRDILITTDNLGNIRYFNKVASVRFALTEKDIGKPIVFVFDKKLGRRILSLIEESLTTGVEVRGAEGIYKNEDLEIDFSLNISPLLRQRGKKEGITLLFTDQSREKELQKKVRKVREERRIIKDMFSRYISSEIVSTLVENPALVHLGGDKKEATIFFADIRGYTSFSEGRDPEYIIDVLNEYFSEAVEIIIKNRGYIDKFIGDCIMAAWGVPLQTKEDDARLAVNCALEIQNAVKNPKRRFFRGEASSLKIGIGMHTGPLVAGNLGSHRRLEYTVIGDTVNIASRLEGVAGPGEVIITEKTKSYLGKSFRLEKREPVRVKGKEEPINIYRVLRKVG